MPAVTKLGKGIASLADARAAKEAKERRRADLTERLMMTQQARAETETAKKMAWDEVKGMEAAHPGLHDLVRSGKEVEWLSNADKLMHTRGVDRGVFYDTVARKYGLPEGEAAKQAIDEFFDAIEHLTKANKDIKSFSEREAKLDAALKKLSATVGIPPATLMAEIQQPEYGTREDGTAKGEGYLGLIPTGRGDEVMSEKSMGIEVDGKEVLIPLIVPTLNSNEIEFLKTYDGPVQGIPESIKRKAQDHAFKRMGAGQSPFAESGDVPEQGPNTRSSESQRIEDEYGLSTQAMLDRYKQTPYQHPESYEAKAPARALTAGQAARMFGRGMSQVPSNILDDAAFLAPHSLPGRISEYVTNKDARKGIQSLADRTRDYWVTQPEPETPAEEVLNELGQWVSPL